MARSLFARAVWFLLVGWWLTFLAINVAWFLNVTVVGLPVGIKIINRVPTLLTLKERRDPIDADTGRSQHSLLVRAGYFLLVGWWLSFLWANLAWALAASIVGLPVAVVMFNYLPYLTSLYRFDG
ncbi:YccF domain-containing protein [Haloarchaeobius sp. FL176]|uniref:YccF domain-containing protein n=1 Tax=Haloarchaeobius sp. FL176 TaxID=2967129 RepID=UPI002147D006|nr:YccF domain-containing protein [Haloarchaeobius sp. FL176]